MKHTMFSSKCLLLGLLLLLTLFLDPTSGRKGSGGHSYPKSGGLSGGGHRSGGLSGSSHGYPSSGSHGYPSGGLSGGGHGYPSSGGSHGYPSSGGSHGNPSSGGSHGYPSSGGSHGYPSSGGSHGYPSSGGSHGYPSGGLSGNGHGYPSANKGHTTINNYHYSPPQQIRYTSAGGGVQSYPVYRGQLPTEVYRYKNSDSKYGTLLAGLALMNLGTLGVATYAATRNHNYKPQPGEVCKFGVKKDNGEYEETKIDCQTISGFILQDQQSHPQNAGTNSTVTTTTTVTNTTIVNTTNGMPEQTSTAAPETVLYAKLPDGTLVPVNATGVQINPPVNTTVASAPNGTMTSSVVVTTTTTNTTLVNALDVKGKPVEVTPGMQCFVIRQSPTSSMRKPVPCGLLQTYADKSIRRNSATHHAPMFTIAAAIVAYCVAY